MVRPRVYVVQPIPEVALEILRTDGEPRAQTSAIARNIVAHIRGEYVTP